MFLDYISGVLPELGVGDIGQTTFGDWALALLEHSVQLVDPSETMAYWFEERRTQEEIDASSGRWKGSLAFKAAIDERLSQLRESIVPETAFSPLDGFTLMPAMMKEWYETDYGDETVMVKRDRLASRIRRWLESELKHRNVADKKKRSAALAKLNSFVKRIPSYTALQLYASLFKGKTALEGMPKRIAKATSERLQAGYAGVEDLAPLTYIQLKLYGLKVPPFDHIVIDEAQDYSPFQLEALRLCQRTPSMTVLGDLQQGIHAYAGIQRWDELKDLFALHPGRHDRRREAGRSGVPERRSGRSGANA
jgi:DNA helicase-2/ATP-dependent DNA helicase PcrA